MRIVLILLFLTGCASINQKAYNEYMEQQAAIRNSGQINSTELVSRLDKKRVELWGHLPYDDEFFAYGYIVAKKIDAGDLSREDGRYMLAQKRIEILERSGAERRRENQDAYAAGALGLGYLNAGAPRSLNSNSINCQSYRTGPITNTNCQ